MFGQKKITKADVARKVPFELAQQLFELDKTIVGYAKLMVPTQPLEPDDRIKAAESLVELQKARKQLIGEIMSLVKAPEGKLH